MTRRTLAEMITEATLVDGEIPLRRIPDINNRSIYEVHESDLTTQADAVMTHTLATPDPNMGAAFFWGRSASNDKTFLRSANDGSSYSGGLWTFADHITAIIPLPSGTVLVATADTVSNVTKSTSVKMWRATGPTVSSVTFNEVTSFTSVVTVGGYVHPFSWAVDASGHIYVAMYGVKDGSTNSARYLYRSTDDGVTWILIHDLGATPQLHNHNVYVDSDEGVWLTIGDTPSPLTTNAKAIFHSTDHGDTWTPYTFTDDAGGRIQFVPIVEFGDWMYAAEDNTAHGRVYRFKKDDPEGTFELVFDIDRDYTGIGKWTAPFYALGVDSTYGVMYGIQYPEIAGLRGRVMMTVDGVNWLPLFEMGIAGSAPNSSMLRFSAKYCYYGPWRWSKKRIVRSPGNHLSGNQVFTFHWPGTIASQADKWVIPFDLLGFSGRVVRVAIYVGTPGSSPVSVTARKGSGGTSICATDPSVANGASGTALAAQGIMFASPILLFSWEMAQRLHLDVTAAGGGSDLTVMVEVERVGSSPVTANWS